MSRMPPNEDRSSGTRIAPMELEVFQPMLIRQSASNGRRMASDRGHPIDDFVIMVRLYIEYYPRLSSLLVIMFLCFGIYMLAYQIRKPVTRNRLSHDYTKIDLHYNWKSSQIDHWCLWVSLAIFLNSRRCDLVEIADNMFI